MFAVLADPRELTKFIIGFDIIFVRRGILLSPLLQIASPTRYFAPINRSL
jgi:hypothetical protein